MIEVTDMIVKFIFSVLIVMFLLLLQKDYSELKTRVDKTERDLDIIHRDMRIGKYKCHDCNTKK